MAYNQQYHYHSVQPSSINNFNCQYWEQMQQNFDTPLKKLLHSQQQKTNEQMHRQYQSKSIKKIKQLNVRYNHGKSVGKLKGNSKQLSTKLKIDRSFENIQTGKLANLKNKKAKSIQVFCRNKVKTEQLSFNQPLKNILSPTQKIIQQILKQKSTQNFQIKQNFKKLSQFQLLEQNEEIRKQIELYQKKMKQQDKKSMMMMKNIGYTKAKVSKLQKEYLQLMLENQNKQISPQKLFNTNPYQQQNNHQSYHLHSFNFEKQGHSNLQYEINNQLEKKPRDSILNHLTKKFYFDSHFKQEIEELQYSLFSKKNLKSGRNIKEGYNYEKGNCSTDRCTQIEDKYKLSSKKISLNESLLSQNQFASLQENKAIHQKDKNSIEKYNQAKSAEFGQKSVPFSRSIKSITFTVRPSYNKKNVDQINQRTISSKILKPQIYKSKQITIRGDKSPQRKNEYPKYSPKLIKNEPYKKRPIAQLLKQKGSYLNYKQISKNKGFHMII